MKALVIETATERGLIAITEDHEVIASTLLPTGLNQSKFLMPELQKLLAVHEISFEEIDCIATGIGPGSYTGMRIGVSVAKAIAYARKLPLIGFSGLYAFTPEKREIAFAGLVDARIGGAYCFKGYLTSEGVLCVTSESQVIPLEELGSFLEDVDLIVSPAVKVLKNKADRLYSEDRWKWQEVEPSARNLARIVCDKYRIKEWTPDTRLDLLYLRKTQAETEKESR